jgi:hypothetical protein
MRKDSFALVDDQAEALTPEAVTQALSVTLERSIARQREMWLQRLDLKRDKAPKSTHPSGDLLQVHSKYRSRFIAPEPIRGLDRELEQAIRRKHRFRWPAVSPGRLAVMVLSNLLPQLFFLGEYPFWRAAAGSFHRLERAKTSGVKVGVGIIHCTAMDRFQLLLLERAQLSFANLLANGLLRLLRLLWLLGHGPSSCATVGKASLFHETKWGSFGQRTSAAYGRLCTSGYDYFAFPVRGFRASRTSASNA